MVVYVMDVVAISGEYMADLPFPDRCVYCMCVCICVCVHVVCVCVCAFVCVCACVCVCVCVCTCACACVRVCTCIRHACVCTCTCIVYKVMAHCERVGGSLVHLQTSLDHKVDQSCQ